MRAGLYIGTSGWSYPGWKDDFFAGVPRKDWLRHYVTQFGAVKVNATFYGRLQPSTFERWEREAPAGVKFAIKGNRYLTHVSRLLFSPDALARKRDIVMTLGDKLAVVIWQMPWSLKLDLPRIEGWLGEGRQVHVYFDNTDGGHAPKDALRLMAMLQPGSP